MDKNTPFQHTSNCLLGNPPLLLNLSDKLRQKHPFLPTTSPYPIMQFETVLITECFH